MFVHDFLPFSKHCLLDHFPIKLRNKILRFLIKIRAIKRYGHAKIIVYDKAGNIKQVGEGYNLIVDAGKGALADLMIGVLTNTLNNINVGTSSTAPLSTDTDLIAAATPVARQAIQAGGRFRANLLISCSVLIASGTYTRPVTIQEVGLFFDPAATGTMFARAVITGVTLASGDTARVDYEIQL